MPVGESGTSALHARATGPGGVELVAACTPTGPELCFNAIDDNCNAIIDEGCGLSTGTLQFTIAWGDSAADLDLGVTGPSGERVEHGSRASPSQIHIERDCPTEGCNGQNVENAYFDGLEPPRGRYVVEIRLKKLQGARSPVALRFGARIGGRTYGADLALTEADDHRIFTFDL